MSTPLSITQTPSTKKIFDIDEHNDIVCVSSSRDIDKKIYQTRGEIATRLDPNDFRPLSVSPFSQDVRRSTRGSSPAPWRQPSQEKGFKFYCKPTWIRNRGPILVALSQLFGAVMNLLTRLLEIGDDAMHPMLVLSGRMSGTVILSGIYMWWMTVPSAPFGPRDVRWLLVVRGLSGFFGIYGMWYSVMYLPLADATVISFLAPNLAGYLCHILIHEPFTRLEQFASFLALGGVLLITRPVSLFSSPETPTTADGIVEIISRETSSQSGFNHVPTSSERLGAVGMALLGVLGSSISITVLRCIGKRAHPLISMTYFSTWCTVVATTTLSVAPVFDYNQPALRFALPSSWIKWLMLIIIAFCGFMAQLTMTAGLAGEKSNRATAMIYTHMLFAAGFDRWVFGHEMGWMSLTGCGLIVGSALWVALSKKQEISTRDVESGAMLDSEAIAMLAESNEDDDNTVQLENLR
ncbi:uncharacterized protein BCR38DRAFT_127606 [Pseudomassariella vexata]|uniref:EamA domain-containing protein n=1 Tax=Pseudomassariella vexata TaxID=1141098 RepID=A0A1Y2D755_9PEZI|nr:uncharacterized protein BCR38DRAFT_127606 [Pseudomassariella vexata]ORY55112.1 hypothetical protein BCR38DRAFT_127606 [Pseudomassariella vexata]